MRMGIRNWCEVPTVKGGSCTRHTNYYVSDTTEWVSAFPHAEAPQDITGRPAHVFMCGNHLHMLRKTGLDKASVTHLDGLDGLIR